MKSFDDVLNKLEVEAWKSLREQAPNIVFQRQYKAFEIGRGFKELSKNQQRDFDFYLLKASSEKCHPNHFCSKTKMVYKPKTCEEWYLMWDTHGFSGGFELEQPRISDCEGIKQAKEFLNLTIKMWVEDLINLPTAFDFDGCKNAYPMAWVWKSFCAQAKKESIKIDGFLTKFLAVRLC